MKQILIITLMFLTFQLSGQKLRPSIKILVKKIENYNVLETEHVGEAGITTNQYRNYLKLRKKAYTEELLLLLEHKNAVVKGYATWALVDKKYPNLANIFSKFLITGEMVTTLSGCLGTQQDLATELYYRVSYQLFRRKFNTKDSLFFQNQIQDLDSVILYSNIETKLFNTALVNNNGNLKNYSRIKELAEKHNSSSTIVALAKYKKQSDIPFIIKQRRLAFLAISVFPDSLFWDFLMGYKANENSLDYFLAVSSFRNELSLSVLNEIYKSCDSIQINDLAMALIKNYSTLYQDLILKIWEEHKIIELNVAKKLISECPEKCSKSFAKGLLSDKKFHFLELSYYWSSDLIPSLMLQTISKYDSNLIPLICNKNILTAKFTYLESFLYYIKLNNVSQTTKNLLQRLEEKNQAFEIFHITETLLSFKNPETNKVLTKILILNKSDWDWGNWSDSFKKLFEANDIKID